MNSQEKVQLTAEQETLLVPLYCKIHECESIFSDPKAREIAQQIEYDFSGLDIPRKTCHMLCMRAHQFDCYTQEFLTKHHESTVLHLGCGLDSRNLRIKIHSNIWYDLDLPEVMDLRNKFYEESDCYHMLSYSVTEKEWLDQISANNNPVLILAEGLFMYLTEGEVKKLIQSLVEKFSHGALIFDAFSTLTAQHASSHPSLHSTGAKTLWGLDDPGIIEKWIERIKLEEEWYFTQSSQLRNLSWIKRLPYRIANLFTAAKRAHRILYYNF